MFPGMSDANLHGISTSPKGKGWGQYSGIWVVSILSIFLGVCMGTGDERWARQGEVHT